MKIPIHDRIDALFSPCLCVQFKRGKVWPDSVHDYPLWNQFVHEAGFRGTYQPESNYDRILAAASVHGYSFESLINE